MKPVIRTFPARRVVGLAAKFVSALAEGTNAQEVIPGLWHRYIGRRAEIPSTLGPVDYGVMTDLPAREKSHPAEMLYVACAEVKRGAKVPKGMTSVSIPMGRYAVFTHRGPIEQIRETIDFVYRTWLPSSKKKLRKAPHLEVYGRRFNPGSPDSEMEICLLLS